MSVSKDKLRLRINCCIRSRGRSRFPPGPGELSKTKQLGGAALEANGSCCANQMPKPRVTYGDRLKEFCARRCLRYGERKAEEVRVCGARRSTFRFLFRTRTKLRPGVEYKLGNDTDTTTVRTDPGKMRKNRVGRSATMSVDLLF